jgi:hypothetical protein
MFSDVQGSRGLWDIVLRLSIEVYTVSERYMTGRWLQRAFL